MRIYKFAFLFALFFLMPICAGAADKLPEFVWTDAVYGTKLSYDKNTHSNWNLLTDAVTFRYNPFCFTPRTIKPLAKYFEIAMGCLLLAYDQKFSIFEEIYQENIKGWDKTFASYML